MTHGQTRKGSVRFGIIGTAIVLAVCFLIYGVTPHQEAQAQSFEATSARVAKVIESNNIFGDPVVTILVEPVGKFNFVFKTIVSPEFSPTAPDGKSCTISLSTTKPGYIITVPAEGGYDACTQPPPRPHGDA